MSTDEPDPPLALTVLEGALGIARLPPAAPVPGWAERGSWCSITRTSEELSVVCDAALIPRDVPQSAPWRPLKVDGPLDFALTGILNRIAEPLAVAEVSIFAVSTYDTDYILVPERRLEAAVARLEQAGIVVRRQD